MILRWQAARDYPATGFLNAPQHQALLTESASTAQASVDDTSGAVVAALAIIAVAAVRSPRSAASWAVSSAEYSDGGNSFMPLVAYPPPDHPM